MEGAGGVVGCGVLGGGDGDGESEGWVEAGGFVEDACEVGGWEGVVAGGEGEEGAAFGVGVSDWWFWDWRMDDGGLLSLESPPRTVRVPPSLISSCEGAASWVNVPISMVSLLRLLRSMISFHAPLPGPLSHRADMTTACDV